MGVILCAGRGWKGALDGKGCGVQGREAPAGTYILRSGACSGEEEGLMVEAGGGG